jgi:hypothetical protein
VTKPSSNPLGTRPRGARPNPEHELYDVFGAKEIRQTLLAITGNLKRLDAPGLIERARAIASVAAYFDRIMAL